jgi:hypothetical protein
VSLPAVREHTDAVIAALEGLELAVGDAIAPDQDPPYVVVYPIPGGGSTGTLGAQHDDAILVYQVTCVGSSREQAEWLADKALELLEGSLSVDGRRVCNVDLDMHGGVQRDDQVTPPVFWSMPRFRITTTPSGEES